MKTDAMKTPLFDLMTKALDDYEQAAMSVHHYNSDIPKAIRAYYSQQPTTELIEWLNSECPAGTETADLSHGFAEALRQRLDDLRPVKAEKVTDEMIEKWAKADIHPVFTGVEFDIAYNARIKGAKAMRDGKIK